MLIAVRRAAMCLMVLAANAGAQDPSGPGRSTVPLPSSAPGHANRITILTDAFGASDHLAQDWGYAALLEYGGKRILFDTGNDSERFSANVRALGIDLRHLDAVVISHRHGDHTDGLRHLLAVNPQVVIYVPDDEYFGGPTPRAFFAQGDSSLPSPMRYFRGAVPDSIPHGSPWRGNLVRVGNTREVLPGVRLLRNLAPGKQFGETPELSLVLATPAGSVLLVGCSHPGIEQILASLGPPPRMGVATSAPGETTTTITPATAAGHSRVHMIVGGLHLVTTPPDEVRALAARLRTTWGVGAIAPGHCTGEHAFARLQQVFGEDYVYAGVGTVIPLP